MVIQTRLTRRQVIDRLRSQVPETKWIGLIPIGISGSVGEREVRLSNRASFTRSSPVRLRLTYEEGAAGTRLVGRFGPPIHAWVGTAFLLLLYAVVAIRMVPEALAGRAFGTGLLLLVLVPALIYVGVRFFRSLRDAYRQELVDFVEGVFSGSESDATAPGGVVVRPRHLQPE